MNNTKIVLEQVFDAFDVGHGVGDDPALANHLICLVKSNNVLNHVFFEQYQNSILAVSDVSKNNEGNELAKKWTSLVNRLLATSTKHGDHMCGLVFLKETILQAGPYARPEVYLNWLGMTGGLVKSSVAQLTKGDGVKVDGVGRVRILNLAMQAFDVFVLALDVVYSVSDDNIGSGIAKAKGSGNGMNIRSKVCDSIFPKFVNTCIQVLKQQNTKNNNNNNNSNSSAISIELCEKVVDVLTCCMKITRTAMRGYIESILSQCYSILFQIASEPNLVSNRPQSFLESIHKCIAMSNICGKVSYQDGDVWSECFGNLLIAFSETLDISFECIYEENSTERNSSVSKEGNTLFRSIPDVKSIAPTQYDKAVLVYERSKNLCGIIKHMFKTGFHTSVEFPLSFIITKLIERILIVDSFTPCKFGSQTADNLEWTSLMMHLPLYHTLALDLLQSIFKQRAIYPLLQQHMPLICDVLSRYTVGLVDNKSNNNTRTSPMQLYYFFTTTLVLFQLCGSSLGEQFVALFMKKTLNMVFQLTDGHNTSGSSSGSVNVQPSGNNALNAVEGSKKKTSNIKRSSRSTKRSTKNNNEHCHTQHTADNNYNQGSVTSSIATITTGDALLNKATLLALMLENMNCIITNCSGMLKGEFFGKLEKYACYQLLYTHSVSNADYSASVNAPQSLWIQVAQRRMINIQNNKLVYCWDKQCRWSLYKLLLSCFLYSCSPTRGGVIQQSIQLFHFGLSDADNEISSFCKMASNIISLSLVSRMPCDCTSIGSSIQTPNANIAYDDDDIKEDSDDGMKALFANNQVFDTTYISTGSVDGGQVANEDHVVHLSPRENKRSAQESMDVDVDVGVDNTNNNSYSLSSGVKHAKIQTDAEIDNKQEQSNDVVNNKSGGLQKESSGKGSIQIASVASKEDYNNMVQFSPQTQTQVPTITDFEASPTPSDGNNDVPTDTYVDLALGESGGSDSEQFEIPDIIDDLPDNS